MPLDFTHNLSAVPDAINFPVEFEPTKVADKKYVINGDTGEYIGIVGKGFTCASHGDFYRGVYDTITENLLPSELENAKYTWRSARDNAWSMLDISLHGVDGSCSNQAFFGAIDFFCTNGSITGEYDQVRKKNTSNFTLEGFIYELRRARTDFYQQTAKMQVWAETDLKYVNVQSLLEDMIASKRKSEKMYELYCQEASQRGHNKWALYSAFTNYASYADERNGFNLRNTGNDTQAISMFSREQEVSKWVCDKRFVELEAA